MYGLYGCSTQGLRVEHCFLRVYLSLGVHEIAVAYSITVQTKIRRMEHVVNMVITLFEIYFPFKHKIKNMSFNNNFKYKNSSYKC